MRKTIRGFTIVELIVVIVVIGILATIGVVSFSVVQTKSRDSQREDQIMIIANALENYYNKNGEYPSCSAMSALPATVATTLTGLDATVLKTPSDSTGTNSISNLCASLSTSIDKFAYSSSGCTSQACSRYTLEYREEATGQIKKLTSRHISFTFVKAWGGTDFDTGRSLVQTSDGGYAVTGYTNNYGAGSNDMFLAKYDSAGTLSWSKTWGGAGSEYGNSLVQTSDGGYAVTGNTTSYGGSVGYDAMFLAKYTSDGTLSWSKAWSGTGGDAGDSLVQTNDGGYAVTGGTHISAGNLDMFLGKYTSDGTLSWSKAWSGTGGSDGGASLVQTNDGGYAVTGGTTSYGGSGGHDAMFLAKYTSAGTLSWNKTWGSASSYAVGCSLVQTNDGGYAVTGYTPIFDPSNSDMFLAKYDSAGTLSWNKTWGGTGSDQGYSLVQTNDGGYAVTGYTTSYGAGDMFLAKYNSSGVIVNCSAPMCQSPTATETVPTATETVPTVTETVPTATETVPTVTPGTPTATSTVIVAP